MDTDWPYARCCRKPNRRQCNKEEILLWEDKQIKRKCKINILLSQKYVFSCNTFFKCQGLSNLKKTNNEENLHGKEIISNKQNFYIQH